MGEKMKWVNRLVPKWVFEFYPIWRNYRCPHCSTILQIRGITSEIYECVWCEGVYMEVQK